MNSYIFQNILYFCAKFIRDKNIMYNNKQNTENNLFSLKEGKNSFLYSFFNKKYLHNSLIFSNLCR